LITSRWPLLQQVFASGTMHVDNSAREIAAAVRRIREKPSAFRAEMSALRQRRAEISGAQVERLRKMCHAGSSRSQS